MYRHPRSMQTQRHSPGKTGQVDRSSTGALWLRVVSRLLDLYRAMGNEAAAAELEAELRAHLRLAHADYPLLAQLAASGRN